ncbi:ABZJ_00895 family protein [Acinetobacter tianfuensis]|uniref:Uncharacterized protein n=1 Tax=Acinetobacter tianfuensis TaxID=2419603 RepID=A0A3A8EF50_9GAMM|nr:ABZJ_00895 family protein [Acinetobacter tianfuensis]RKG32779.1 hypothetical protein D7V32_04745 [Acinetobacter tianfuensis]
MKKYITYFSIVYLIVMAVLAVIISYFDLPSSTSVACLLAAGYAAAGKFVQDHERVPDAQEKKQLIWGCLGASIAISICVSIIFLLIAFQSLSFLSMLSAVPLWIIVLAIAFTVLIHYFILAMSFGWYANSCLKGLQKRNKRKS